MPDGSIDRLAICEFHLRLTVELIKLADQKARFLMRISLAIFAATFIGLPPLVGILREYLDQKTGSLFMFCAIALLYGLCVSCLMIGVTKVIEVIQPRIVRGDANENKSSRFFFHHIAQIDAQQFERSIANLEPDQAWRETALQLYQTANVAQAKYHSLDRAVRWLVGGGALAVVFAILVTFTVQLG